MKRCWIGAGFLIALLVLGLFATWGMDRCHNDIAQDARQAAQAALEEDWNRADTLTGQAQGKWRRCWGISAALADHEVMEQINGYFAQMEVYSQARDKASFAAACAQLEVAAEAMADAHSLQWWNIL